MNPSVWLAHAAALAGVVFVMSITPGPNNIMVLGSGKQFGVRRTVPHLLGITGGFVALLLLVYAGVGTLVLGVPGFATALAVACGAYLLWIAWQLASSRPPASSPSATVDITARKPWNFLQAASFQFVNPKCWAIAATCVGIATELPAGPSQQLIMLVAVTAVVNLPCVWIWAVFGANTNQWLKSPRTHYVFNMIMALLLVATVVWMLKDYL